MDGRAVRGLVTRGKGTVTMKAASMHALRDLCCVNILVDRGPSTARSRLRMRR